MMSCLVTHRIHGRNLLAIKRVDGCGVWKKILTISMMPSLGRQDEIPDLLENWTLTFDRLYSPSKRDNTDVNKKKTVFNFRKHII